MFGNKVEMPEKIDNRFKEVSMNDNTTFGTHMVLKDIKTGVLYYMVQAKHGGGIGLTPLLNSDGTVVVESTD